MFIHVPTLPLLTKTLHPCPPNRRRSAAGPLLWLALALAGSTSRAPAAPTLAEQANPTNEAQYLLQKLNRARLDPAGEGQRLADWLRNTSDGQVVVTQYKTNPDQVKSDFAALPAVSPLVFNSNLGAAALAHSTDLAAHNGLGPGATTLADNGKVGPDGYTLIGHLGYDGSTPSSRVNAAGYTAEFTGENVASGFDSLDLIHAGYLIDWGNPGLGHRQSSMSGNSTQNVVGVGMARENGNSLLIETEDFGYPHPAFNGSTLVAADVPALLTGVVYHDTNGNGQYDVGEGAQGATVTMDGGSFYALTSASGGYALPLVSADGVNVDGNVTVHATFSDGSSVSRTVTITHYNSQLGSYRGNVEWEVTTTTTASPLASFFAGSNTLAQGWNYLGFADGNVFGYYNTDLYPFLYHNDLGWEYVLDAQDGHRGVYLYDFQSGAWWYTSPGFPFPYLYDFSRQSALYYYPDPARPGGYTRGPRWFFDFAAGKVIAL